MRNTLAGMLDTLLSPRADNIERRRQAKHLASITITRGVVILVQLFYIKLYSNLLTKPELGLYAFWMAVSYGWTALIFIPLDQFQQTNFLRMRARGISILSFLPMNKIVLTTTAIICLLGMVGQTIWQKHTSFELLICYALAVATYFASSLRNFVNNLGHKTVTSMSMVVEAICKVAFLFVFVRLTLLKPIGIVGMAALAMGAVVLSIAPFIRKYQLFAGTKREYPNSRVTVLFCMPLAAQALLNWLQLRGVSFLAPFGNAEAIGIYFTVAAIGQAGMAAVASILTQMFVPELLKSEGAFLKPYLLICGAATALMMLIVALFGTLLTRLLTNVHFSAYALLAEFGIVVEAGNLMLTAATIYLQLRNKTIGSLISGLIALGICLAVIGTSAIFGWFTPYTIGSALGLSQLGAVAYLIWQCQRLEHYQRPQAS